MFVVVSYDTPDDGRRRRILKTLKDFGVRVQYSVFECDLDEAGYQRLRQRLSPLVDRGQDSVRFYILCRQDVRKRRIWGKERSQPAPAAYYLVRRSRGGG